MRPSCVHIISRWAVPCLLTCLLLLCGSTEARAQTPATAYQVKAVFLYNFTQFVEWPPQALNSNTAFVIGILGGDPFGNYLDAVVANEKVGGRPIVVKRFNSVSEIGRCHLLFIHNANTKDVVQAVQGKNILTVGDDDNFLRDGGIIRFFIERSRIRLQINAAAARASSLDISSKLLRLADVLNKQ